MLAVDMDYERLSGQLIAEETARLWSWREMAYVERPCYVVSLGKQDGVRADADAAMTPERMPGDANNKRAEAARNNAHALRQATDLAVLRCLREYGPQTRGEIAARIGKVDDTVTESLRRRPDLFESDGRNYNRTWWAKERSE